MNEKRTNFCSFSVGPGPATAIFMQGSHAIHSATEVCKNLRAFFIILVYVLNSEKSYNDHIALQMHTTSSD